MPVILATGKAEYDHNSRPAQELFPETQFPKITRAKWTDGGVGQVVKHLLYKHKTLISNPNLTNKIKC
jgi:hypothetical protein